MSTSPTPLYSQPLPEYFTLLRHNPDDTFRIFKLFVRVTTPSILLRKELNIINHQLHSILITLRSHRVGQNRELKKLRDFDEKRKPGWGFFTSSRWKRCKPTDYLDFLVHHQVGTSPARVLRVTPEGLILQNHIVLTPNSISSA